MRRSREYKNALDSRSTNTRSEQLDLRLPLEGSSVTLNYN